MVCAGIIDHCESDNTDKYWIELYRLPALLGTEYDAPASFADSMMCAVTDCYVSVANCFPNTGPNGKFERHLSDQKVIQKLCHLQIAKK